MLREPERGQSMPSHDAEMRRWRGSAINGCDHHLAYRDPLVLLDPQTSTCCDRARAEVERGRMRDWGNILESPV